MKKKIKKVVDVMEPRRSGYFYPVPSIAFAIPSFIYDAEDDDVDRVASPSTNVVWLEVLIDVVVVVVVVVVVAEAADFDVVEWRRRRLDPARRGQDQQHQLRHARTGICKFVAVAVAVAVVVLFCGK